VRHLRGGLLPEHRRGDLVRRMRSREILRYGGPRGGHGRVLGGPILGGVSHGLLGVCGWTVLRYGGTRGGHGNVFGRPVRSGLGHGLLPVSVRHIRDIGWRVLVDRVRELPAGNVVSVRRLGVVFVMRALHARILCPKHWVLDVRVVRSWQVLVCNGCLFGKHMSQLRRRHVLKYVRRSEFELMLAVHCWDLLVSRVCFLC